MEALEHALDSPDDAVPGPLSQALDAPVLVDRSRSELPDAAELISRPASPPPGQPAQSG